MPNSSNPELQFVQKIESDHSLITNGISYVSFSAPRNIITKDDDGNRIVWQFQEDGTIKQHKEKSYEILRRMTSFAQCFTDVTNSFVFTGYDNGTIIQWQYPQQKIFKIWKDKYNLSVTVMVWNHETRSLIVADISGHMKEWTPPQSTNDEPKMIRDWGKVHTEQINCMFHLVNKNELFTVGRGPEVKKWSLKSKNYGKLIKDYSKILNIKNRIKGIVVNDYGNILFYSDGRYIRKVCLNNGKHYESYDDHKFPITNLIISYQNKYKEYWQEDEENKKNDFSIDLAFNQELEKQKHIIPCNSESVAGQIININFTPKNAHQKSPVKRCAKGSILNFTSFVENSDINNVAFPDDVVKEKYLMDIIKEENVEVLTKSKSSRDISVPVFIPLEEREKTDEEKLILKFNLSPRDKAKIQNLEDCSPEQFSNPKKNSL